MTEFIENFDQTKEQALNDQRAAKATIVGLLEHISSGLESQYHIPDKGRMKASTSRPVGGLVLILSIVTLLSLLKLPAGEPKKEVDRRPVNVPLLLSLLSRPERFALPGCHPQQCTVVSLIVQDNMQDNTQPLGRLSKADFLHNEESADAERCVRLSKDFHEIFPKPPSSSRVPPLFSRKSARQVHPSRGGCLFYHPCDTVCHLATRVIPCVMSSPV